MSTWNSRIPNSFVYAFKVLLGGAEECQVLPEQLARVVVSGAGKAVEIHQHLVGLLKT